MEVESANCTCPRGLFKCHHMAVLLLHAQKTVSKTDTECQWVKKKSQDETRYVLVNQSEQVDDLEKNASTISVTAL